MVELDPYIIDCLGSEPRPMNHTHGDRLPTSCYLGHQSVMQEGDCQRV